MKVRWLMGLGVVVLAAAVVVWFEPTGVVRGWLRGESFFQGRPASWWREALASQDPAAENRAIGTLKEGGPDAVPVLVAILRGDDRGDWGAARVRCTAAEVLGQIGPKARPAADPVLLAALKDPDPAVRKVAASALVSVGVPADQAVPALIELLATPNRLDAVKVLARFGGAASGAVPALIGLLKDSEPDVRWNAARTLGLIGPAARESVPALLAALHDEDADVREHAAESLGQIGVAAPDVVAALAAALNDPNERVRRDAVRSLGQFGPKAGAARDAVAARRKDDAEKVRTAAEVALRRIDPKGSRQ